MTKWIAHIPGWVKILSILGIAVLWKIWLLSQQAISFNSDEAIVALMARHILAGERPIFFYGQAYMGSLDAFLVALGFYIFGEFIWVIRLVQIIIYTLVIATSYWFCRLVFAEKTIGIIVALLLALPCVNLTLYTTASLGGYNEVLLIGNLILISTVYIWKNLSGSSRGNQAFFSFVLFFLIGSGFWIMGLTLLYSIPAFGLIIYAIYKKRKIKALWLITSFLGMLLGLLPIIIYVVQNGTTSLFMELFGSAVNIENVSFSTRTLNHLIYLFLLGIPVWFGMRAPWETSWLALPFIVPAFVILGGSIFYFVKNVIRKEVKLPESLLLLGLCILFMFGFLFTAFGTDPTGRYFLPITIMLYIFTGYTIFCISKKTWVLTLFLILIIVFNIVGTIESMSPNPPGLTTQFYAPSQIDHEYDRNLIQFLELHNATRGYSNYWVAYPIAFLSGEQIIFVPRLPYHEDLSYTSRDNRIGFYQNIVDQSESTAFIVTHNYPLEQLLASTLQQWQVTWREAIIGDYHIYYQLSRHIYPNEVTQIFSFHQ